MTELIPTYILSDFKKLKASEIRRLKSCELTSDGEYVCTVVIPSTDYIKVLIEYNAQLSNSLRGEEIDDILKKVEVG